MRLFFFRKLVGSECSSQQSPIKAIFKRETNSGVQEAQKMALCHITTTAEETEASFLTDWYIMYRRHWLIRASASSDIGRWSFKPKVYTL